MTFTILAGEGIIVLKKKKQNHNFKRFPDQQL